jgi:hypothetical protein
MRVIYDDQPPDDEGEKPLDQSGLFPDLVGMDPPSILQQPLMFGPAPDDPLEVPCWRCGAPAGNKCRNYKGENKFTCKERGTPAPGPAPRDDQSDLFGDTEQ